jgi:RNA polymerase sigma-70 factor, ECF subfamily
VAIAASQAAGDTARDAAVTAAFRALFSEHARFAWRALVNFGLPPSEAEDACQEVFVVVLRRLEEGTVPEEPRAWLYSICWRVSAGYRRKGYRKKEVTSELADEAAPDSGQPATLVERRRRLERLERALATLSDAQRAVFILYEIEQLSMREVAEALECSINTAFSRLYSARRRVAAELEIVVPQEVWKR